MATRRPLVIVNGGTQELPAGDYVAGVDTSTWTRSITAWDAYSFQAPASAFATFGARNGTLVAEFDAASDERMVVSGVIPDGANLSSGLKIRITWMGATATSGNVRWRVALERGNTDLDSDSFDTAAEATGAANGTSGVATTTEVTLTTIDSITAGEVFRLRFTRVGTDATNDTMSGDAQVRLVELRVAA